MASLGRPGTSAPKKLVIKPLKKAPRLPDNFEQATWAKLLEAVQAVHTKRAVTHSLEELYRGVEDLCLQNMAARTYERLEAECESHIQASLEALRGQTPDTRAFLSLMHGCWSAHCEEMLTLRSIFLYLDRTYVMQTAAKKSLWEMGLASFRTHLSGRPDVVSKLRAGLLALIEQERSGDQVERSLLAELLRMLYDLGLYQRHFEVAFLEATTEFYLAEGAQKLLSLDVPTLLLHVSGRLAAEEARVAHYLHASSRKPLLAAVRRTLLAVHVPAILDKGFDALVDQVPASPLGDPQRIQTPRNTTRAPDTGTRRARPPEPRPKLRKDWLLSSTTFFTLYSISPALARKELFTPACSYLSRVLGFNLSFGLDGPPRLLLPSWPVVSTPRRCANKRRRPRTAHAPRTGPGVSGNRLTWAHHRRGQSLGRRTVCGPTERRRPPCFEALRN